MVRASVLEILQQDFVLTLRAKGLWSRTVTRHVIKNAAPPVLTLMGLQFGYLLGGSVLVETVSRPQPAVLPRAARGGPLPVTRSPSYPADPGRPAACRR